jgi:hypothetical protein
MTADTLAERSYEIAYCAELASGPGRAPALFAPAQVLEKILGFDAAAGPPSGHVVWKVLGLPRPAGVSLLPGLWAGGARPKAASLPRYPVSLFFQFKRSEYLHGGRAKQWRMWGKSPYYRFARTKHQQQVRHSTPLPSLSRLS